MSPMLEVEPYIIVLIDQLSKMRVLITCQQGLELANSLVSGKSIMENIVLWRQKHCISFREDPTLSKPLGSGYWRGFMSRNWLHVKAKKGVKFDGKRADWCTLRNFEQMYRDAYEEMAKMGIAEKLDEEVWLNKSGDVVANEEGALGMKTKYILKHPLPTNSYLLMKSEVTPVRQKMDRRGVRKCYVLEQRQDHNNEVL